MKTILRSTLAVALLASAAPALAGEDPPDQGTTGVQQSSAPEMDRRDARSDVGAGFATDAPAEGGTIAAAQDMEPSRSLGDDPLDRSMDAGG